MPDSPDGCKHSKAEGHVVVYQSGDFSTETALRLALERLARTGKIKAALGLHEVISDEENAKDARTYNLGDWAVPANMTTVPTAIVWAPGSGKEEEFNWFAALKEAGFGGPRILVEMIGLEGDEDICTFRQSATATATMPTTRGNTLGAQILEALGRQEGRKK